MFDYTKWNSNGATMPLGIDRNSDGSIDETIQLNDDDKVSAAKPVATAAPAESGTLIWIGGAVVLGALVIGLVVVFVVRRKKE